RDLCHVVVGGTLGAGAADLDDGADRCLLGGRGFTQRHVMDPAVDAVDDDADTIAELVGQLLIDQAAHERRPGLLAMKIGGPKYASWHARGECSGHRLDDVAALAEPAQRRLEFFRECPHAWFRFLGEPIACKLLQASDPQRPVEVPTDLAGLWPQIQGSLPG